jgi:polyhydroxyalkanoate synthesis regulator phasin
MACELSKIAAAMIAAANTDQKQTSAIKELIDITSKKEVKPTVKPNKELDNLERDLKDAQNELQQLESKQEADYAKLDDNAPDSA